jgi:hypothetical protein
MDKIHDGGDRFSFENLDVTVTETDFHRVSTIHVVRLEPDEDEEEESKKSKRDKDTDDEDDERDVKKKKDKASV